MLTAGATPLLLSLLGLCVTMGGKGRGYAPIRPSGSLNPPIVSEQSERKWRAEGERGWW